jgi:hypothetical protein
LNSVIITGLSGGSGQYDMTDSYYSTCEQALNGNFNFLQNNSKDYIYVPNGTVYFGLRDSNNPTNVTCVTVFVNCDFGPIA